MNQCCLIENDCEPKFFGQRMVKARIAHKCGECNEPILPGEQYEVSTGMWDGDFDRHKTCRSCAVIRDDLLSCGYTFGAVWLDIEECYGIDPEFLP